MIHSSTHCCLKLISVLYLASSCCWSTTLSDIASITLSRVWFSWILMLRKTKSGLILSSLSCAVLNPHLRTSSLRATSASESSLTTLGTSENSTSSSARSTLSSLLSDVPSLSVLRQSAWSIPLWCWRTMHHRFILRCLCIHVDTWWFDRNLPFCRPTWSSRAKRRLVYCCSLSSWKATRLTLST